MENIVKISLDTSKIEKQVGETIELLKTRFSEGVPDRTLDKLKGLFPDIILGKFAATPGTGDVGKLTFSPSLGSKFEEFLAALRAGEI